MYAKVKQKNIFCWVKLKWKYIIILSLSAGEREQFTTMFGDLFSPVI
jgi:hypothetical protein